MAGSRDRPGKSAGNDEYIGTWLQPLPQPDVREGGESTWELWHEAQRELDAAFGPTQPSGPVPLSHEPRTELRGPEGEAGRIDADALMVQARRYNRVCPRRDHWLALYQQLAGPGYVDLPPPPPDWLWSKLSAIQKRLFFREYLEWAERHDKVADVARFMGTLAEADWLHMGEG